MKKCKNCKYFRPCEDKPNRGVCTNPNRHDRMLAQYFGSLKETDYCALHERKETNNERTRNVYP